MGNWSKDTKWETAKDFLSESLMALLSAFSLASALDQLMDSQSGYYSDQPHYARSEVGRVGKERRCRRAPDLLKESLMALLSAFSLASALDQLMDSQSGCCSDQPHYAHS